MREDNSLSEYWPQNADKVTEELSMIIGLPSVGGGSDRGREI